MPQNILGGALRAAGGHRAMQEFSSPGNVVIGLCLAFIFPHLGLFSPNHRAFEHCEPTSYSLEGSPSLCPGNSSPYLSPHCFTLTNGGTNGG